MRALEMYLSGALLLILVFLVLSKKDAANSVLDSLGNVNVGAIKALQGR